MYREKGCWGRGSIYYNSHIYLDPLSLLATLFGALSLALGSTSGITNLRAISCTKTLPNVNPFLSYLSPLVILRRPPVLVPPPPEALVTRLDFHCPYSCRHLYHSLESLPPHYMIVVVESHTHSNVFNRDVAQYRDVAHFRTLQNWPLSNSMMVQMI